MKFRLLRCFAVAFVCVIETCGFSVWAEDTAVCDAGQYRDGDVCKECPFGYFCENGEKKDCPKDTYSEESASKCLSCAPGYSTAQSGPAENGYDGLCLGRDGDGYGIRCISSDACKLTLSDLSVTRKDQDDEKFILGNNVKIEAINKLVLTTKQ